MLKHFLVIYLLGPCGTLVISMVSFFVGVLVQGGCTSVKEPFQDAAGTVGTLPGYLYLGVQAYGYHARLHGLELPEAIQVLGTPTNGNVHKEHSQGQSSLQGDYTRIL